MVVATHSRYSPKDLIWPTCEAIVLNAASGILGQLLQYVSKEKDSFAFDHVSILQFILFTAVTAAPNWMFQKWMENTWPSRTPPAPIKDNPRPTEELTLNVANTITKFLLDQTVSATVNTLLFFVVLGLIKGQSMDYIYEDIVHNFWALLFAGYRFWPFVCLTNLLVIPFHLRGLVGGLAGLGWGVFLSMRTS